MLVKFSSFAGGVFIEVTDRDEYTLSDRCFRSAGNGMMEYALYGDLLDNGNFARWYGFAIPANQFQFA